MYRTFLRVFAALPLCTVIGQECPGETLFVVHGGLFENKTIKIDHIDKLPRKKYSSLIAPKPRHKASKNDKTIEDMTWSDPVRNNGLELSDRGSGVLFGPDISREWLKHNDCSTIIRSHECIEDGVEHMNLGKGFHLYTVFSASNYSGGDNFAAILIYSDLKSKPKIERFRTKDPPPAAAVKAGNTVKLQDLICRRHFRLQKSFETADPEKTGKLPMEVWQKIMSDIIKIADADWVHLGLDIPLDGENVLYNGFLEKYSVRSYLQHHDKPEHTAAGMNSLYGNYGFLKLVFQEWDVNHDGKVDKEEFKKAIEVMNAGHPDGEQLEAEGLFEVLDHDHSGTIDINELCETSRLVKT